MNTSNPIKLLFKSMGFISFCIPLMVLILVVNWFFGIIPLPRLEGMAVLFPIFTSPIGITLALISFLGYRNKIAVWALILNVLISFLPRAYFYWGTILFGP